MKKIIEFIGKLSKKVKIISLAVIIVLVTGSFFWYQNASSKNGQQPQTAPVEQGMIVSSVSASGQILSVNIMSANTKASGIVKQVFIKDGDMVKKGDKILEIDLDFQGQQKNAQAWSSYLSAKNSLESAKSTQYSLQADLFEKWDSFKNLAENDTYTKDDAPDLENRTLPEFHISEKDWLAAELKYKTQEQVIAQTQAAVTSNWLDYIQTSSTVTAPTDGVITSLMFAEGMSIGTLDTGNVTSNQKIATIQTEGTPIVSVNLSEIDVSRVEIGQKASITLDSIPDKTFTGEVIGVDRIGQTTSGVTQYPSIIQLDTSSPEILPNMTATANIIIDRRENAVLVPASAVQIQNNQSFVRILKDNKEQFVPVEVGLSSDTQTEIVSGVNVGDLIITNSLSSDTKNSQESPFGSNRGMNQMMRIAH